MLLIDGDIIAYRTAFSREADDFDDLMRIADQYVKHIVANADPKIKHYCVYLTGSNNFRKDIAVTAPYKGNRKEKPPYLDDIRNHLLEHHTSNLSEGEEADDKIAILATELGASAVICSIDKDFDQVPGWHYNFVKNTRYCIGTQEGLLNFYCQILTGDAVDNIIGIRGIGPLKARKALMGCSDEVAMYAKCVELYDNEGRVIENGRLLWLRRHAGQIWEPPTSATC